MSKQDKKKKPTRSSALNVRPGVTGGHDGLPGQSTADGGGKNRPRRRLLTAKEYIDGVLSGDRVLLARAITLIESNAPAHQELAQEVLTQLLDKRCESIRVGITGVPGAGKSTFIEALGTASDRARAPGRRHGGGPVEQPDRRQHPRRQDPHGKTGRRPERLHPAFAHRRHPGRGGPQDPRNDHAVRGRRLST